MLQKLTDEQAQIIKKLVHVERECAVDDVDADYHQQLVQLVELLKQTKDFYINI